MHTSLRVTGVLSDLVVRRSSRLRLLPVGLKIRARMQCGARFSGFTTPTSTRKAEGVCVSTAMNRLLQIPGASALHAVIARAAHLSDNPLG
jgi:hypothetical protein